ncbi:HEPN/Toprim-associated domain-containing protein [Actinomadura sp. NPDC049382]|uniref:HEPN/Toprim-associated domain-containing protein n=1 Tax=Actinomadura sp. NPDC049382 TaxID=3158220 RepID=UPI00342E6B43
MYSEVEIGNLRFLASMSGSGYDPDIAALFTEAERYHRVVPPEIGGNDFETIDYGYRAEAQHVRQRLITLGYSWERAWSDLTVAVERWRQEAPSRRRGERRPRTVEQEFEEYREKLEPGPHNWGEFNPLGIQRHMDPRSLLRLMLDHVRGDTKVALDFIEAYDSTPDRPIAAMAREAQLGASTSAPVIVLTEGRTDSRLLAKGMQVTHPHLIGFVTFIDFDGFPAEGGASAMAKLVVSFAAAGVANRVVAIADNDPAGLEAVAKIRHTGQLPANYRILNYPPLEFLNSYPTLGPYSEDPVEADINGRAGALELYLGRDILLADGELIPVQWTSYHRKLRMYQGELLEKTETQRRFEAKVATALGGTAAADADWSGIHAIIEAIITAFA